MYRSLFVSAIVLVVSGCGAPTPGADPHDMSAEHHEKESDEHAELADKHQAQYDAGATKEEENCFGPVGTGDIGDLDVCWFSATNPTEAHLKEAKMHRKHAADHRAASEALRKAEAAACVGIASGERDISPFERVEDITEVTPSEKTPADGVTVVFRKVEGLSVEWLQKAVDCHLARNAALGHAVPNMPDCPLVPHGVEAKVSEASDGFAVAVTSSDPATAKEVRLFTRFGTAIPAQSSIRLSN